MAWQSQAMIRQVRRLRPSPYAVPGTPPAGEAGKALCRSLRTPHSALVQPRSFK